MGIYILILSLKKRIWNRIIGINIIFHSKGMLFLSLIPLLSKGLFAQCEISMNSFKKMTDEIDR